MTFYDKIQTAASFIKEKAGIAPRVGIVSGSGLGSITEVIDSASAVTVQYADIPHFPVSTVKGHDGYFVFGRIGECPVMVMAGRFHYYEGYGMEEVTFPMRVMQALGVDVVVLSNAAGGMNPSFGIGDLMIIRDHINLFPEHPLRGANDDRLGPRFPDMSQAYDHDLIERAKHIATEAGIDVKTGVYVGLQGPTFETPAEYRWLYGMGGDAVGMSTVPETIVARHGGMRVFAMSVITDIGISDEPIHITHEEVLEAANAAAPKVVAIVAALVRQMPV